MDRVLMTCPSTGMPYRVKSWPSEAYAGLDAGIRFAVRLLHSRGFETSQSCQGGEGHAYDRPTVDLTAGPDDATGFGAVEVLISYGLPVRDVSLVWNVDHSGLPYERLWRVTFRTPLHDRADEVPMFEWGYSHRPATEPR